MTREGVKKMRMIFIIFLLLFAFAIGAQILISEYDKDVKISFYDQEEGEYISDVKVTMIPQLPVRMEERLAGKGTIVYGTDKYKLVYITAKKTGYKTKRVVKFIQANEQYTITMKKKEE